MPLPYVWCRAALRSREAPSFLDDRIARMLPPADRCHINRLLLSLRKSGSVRHHACLMTTRSVCRQQQVNAKQSATYTHCKAQSLAVFNALNKHCMRAEPLSTGPTHAGSCSKSQSQSLRDAAWHCRSAACPRIYRRSENPASTADTTLQLPDGKVVLHCYARS